jgi:hypothetical protein
MKDPPLHVYTEKKLHNSAADNFITALLSSALFKPELRCERKERIISK